MTIDIQTYTRKPFEVRGVRVTEENLEEVVAFCNGELLHDSKASSGPRVPLIKVQVKNVSSPRFTYAHVGDWVLEAKGGASYRVYTDRAFRENFQAPSSTVSNSVSTLKAELFDDPAYGETLAQRMTAQGIPEVVSAFTARGVLNDLKEKIDARSWV